MGTTTRTSAVELQIQVTTRVVVQAVLRNFKQQGFYLAFISMLSDRFIYLSKVVRSLVDIFLSQVEIWLRTQKGKIGVLSS
jgi:hypothetical protein